MPRSVVDIPAGRLKPSIDSIVCQLGIPVGRTPDDRTLELVRQAVDLLLSLARPKGVVEGVSIKEFDSIHSGEGLNDSESPLAEIFPSADSLMLYAVTLGEAVGAEIGSLMKSGHYAEAIALDAAASEATETASSLLEDATETNGSQASMAFSPSYCGWHLTGQRKLFEKLRPEEIGLSLNESCLMQPIKSISGVIVVGRLEIFEFEDNFPCCAGCESRSCRDRIERVRSRG